MAGQDKMILRGFEMRRGDYFKRPGQVGTEVCQPIHFIPKAEKTAEWKAMVADYYENIGLCKVSDGYEEIMRNRHLAAGVLDMRDYIKTPDNQFNILKKAGVHVPELKKEDPLYDFHPLIPNLVNLFTGYQLKRNNKITFQLVDPDSKAQLFEMKDQEFKGSLNSAMMNMKQQALYDAGLSPDDPNTQKQFYDEMKANQELVDTQLRFVKYKDVGIEWANRVHKINIQKYDMRNLIKQSFRDYLSSSKVLFHINMLHDRFLVEHIDEAFVFNGPLQNSVYLVDSSHVGWFKWANIPELLREFGKTFKDEDIEKLKVYNTAIQSNSLNLIGFWNNEIEPVTGAQIHADGYDPTKSFQNQPQEPLDITAYKRRMEKEYGITFNNQTIRQTKTNINPEFRYGEDRLFRVMYLYVNSQRKIGWLTKINRDGQVTYQDWVNEDFIVTEEPIYDFSKTTEKIAENLVYGEHIDWEWCEDWRRFIKITPNSYATNYNNYGKNLDCIYIDGDSLPFQFKNDKTPFGVKPPLAGIEIKTRGVKTVPVVKLLKPDQVVFNICKNRVKQVIAHDRGLVLAYPTNLVSRWDNDAEDDGQLLENFEKGMRENKTLRLTYDKQYLAGAGGQMTAPTILNLSTLNEALQYDQLSERVWYNALRTVGVTPQAIGEIKASEEVTNSQSAQQISEVQTELIFDEYNSRLLPELYQRMLEATQYYSTINEEYRLTYLNDNNENTWLDITGLNLMHKDFQCTARFSFDNKEFTDMMKRMAFDNTLQESLLTRLKIIAESEDNPSKVLSILEEAEAKAQENAQKLEEQKSKDVQAQRDHEKEMLDEELAAEKERADLDRRSNEYIAQIKVVSGGIQTDVNANGQLDSYENLKNILKEKEMQQQSSIAKQTLALKSKEQTDNLNMKREEILSKERIADKKLKEAVVNRNKDSDAKLDKKVLGK